MFCLVYKHFSRFYSQHHNINQHKFTFFIDVLFICCNFSALNTVANKLSLAMKLTDNIQFAISVIAGQGGKLLPHFLSVPRKGLASTNCTLHV